MIKYFGFFIAGLVFLADRLSKWWVVDVYDLAHKSPVDLLPFLDLTLVWNRGISLGMFQIDGDGGRYFFDCFDRGYFDLYWCLAFSRKGENSQFWFGSGSRWCGWEYLGPAGVWRGRRFFTFFHRQLVFLYF